MTTEKPQLEQWLTVAQAAAFLEISRNDMHIIPVRRWLMGQTQCYREDELKEWALKNGGSIELSLLREKKKLADEREAKRNNRYTSKGTLKKRFRQHDPLHCPRCGGDLNKQTSPYCVLAHPDIRNILVERLGYAADTDLQVVFAGLLTYRNELENRLVAIDRTLTNEELLRAVPERRFGVYDNGAVNPGDNPPIYGEVDFIEDILEKVQSLKITLRNKDSYILMCAKCFGTYAPSSPRPPAGDGDGYGAEDIPGYYEAHDEREADEDVLAMTTRSFYIVDDGKILGEIEGGELDGTDREKD